MITKTGGVKIMDFGIAHQSSGNATHTQTAAWGTPPYMAPEQALGSVSKAADLYSLAIIGYEMVVGARPFEGPDYQEQKLRRSFTEATKRDASLPSALDGFFAAALDPDPTKRPASASALVDGFRKAAGA